MTLQDILSHRVTWALLGALVSLLGAYFAFTREILREVHQLKGMSTMLLQRLTLLDRVQEKLMGIDKDVDRLKYDQTNAFKLIRELKGGPTHGSAEPSGHG